MARFDATYAPNANINKVDGTNLLGLAGMYNKYLSDIDTRIQNNEMHPLRMDYTKAQTAQADMNTQRGLYDLAQAKFMDQNYMNRFGVNARTRTQDIANDLSLAQTDQLNINNEFSRYNNAETIRVNNMYEQMTGKPAGLSALIKNDTDFNNYKKFLENGGTPQQWFQYKTGVETNDNVNAGTNGVVSTQNTPIPSTEGLNTDVLDRVFTENYQTLLNEGYSPMEIIYGIANPYGESSWDKSKLGIGDGKVKNYAGITSSLKGDMLAKGYDFSGIDKNEELANIKGSIHGNRILMNNGNKEYIDTPLTDTYFQNEDEPFLSYFLGANGLKALKSMPDNAPFTSNPILARIATTNPDFQNKTVAEARALMTGEKMKALNYLKTKIESINVKSDENLTKTSLVNNKDLIQSVISSAEVKKNDNGLVAIDDKETIEKIANPMFVYLSTTEDGRPVVNAMSVKNYQNSDDFIKERLTPYMLGVVPRGDLEKQVIGEYLNNKISENGIAYINHVGKNEEQEMVNNKPKVFLTHRNLVGDDYSQEVNRALFNQNDFMPYTHKFKDIYIKNYKALMNGIKETDDKDVKKLLNKVYTDSNSQIRLNTFLSTGISDKFLETLPPSARKEFLKLFANANENHFDTITYENFLDNYPEIGKILNGKEKKILYGSLKLSSNIIKQAKKDGVYFNGATNDIVLDPTSEFPSSHIIPEKYIQQAMDEYVIQADKDQIENMFSKMIMDNMDLAKKIEFINHLNSNLGSDMYEGANFYNTHNAQPLPNRLDPYFKEIYQEDANKLLPIVLGKEYKDLPEILKKQVFKSSQAFNNFLDYFNPKIMPTKK